MTCAFSEGKEGVRHSVEVREAVVSREDHSFVATGRLYIISLYIANLSSPPNVLIYKMFCSPQYGPHMQCHGSDNSTYKFCHRFPKH